MGPGGPGAPGGPGLGAPSGPVGLPSSQGGPPSPRLPSTGKKPTPINTSPPAKPVNTYTPYSQASTQRPTSTYGAQELATSVYDSPIAPHNPQSAATYTSSIYSQDNYTTGASNVNAPPLPFTQPAPPAPTQYQSYQPSQSQFDAAPPAPTGAAPPVPQGAGSGRPAGALSPSPLQPSGAAFDSRQGLPSQVAGGQQQPQYKPYVPPSSTEPSAPGPDDYYRVASGNML